MFGTFLTPIHIRIGSSITLDKPKTEKLQMPQVISALSRFFNIHVIDSTPVVDENVCLALDWDAKTPDSKVISKYLVRFILFRCYCMKKLFQEVQLLDK